MKSIEILNFKTFNHLKIDNLGLVNLIVGKNNSGKSTLLEAISIIASGGNMGWLRKLLEIRGINNFIPSDSEQREIQELNNFATLYPDNDLRKFKESPIEINIAEEKSAVSAASSVQIKLADYFRFVESDENGSQTMRVVLSDGLNSDEEFLEGEHISGLQISVNSTKSIYIFGTGSLKSFIIERNLPFEYVRTSEFTGDKNPALFDKVALSPLEQELIKGLHIIEPRITAINFLKDETSLRSVSGQRSRENRVPYVVLDGDLNKHRLSTMGDGVNRILTIILSMINCRNGILLIDEFENGLHYTVQTDLWHLICQLAKKLNIQVFATTHSKDCINSFLKATREDRGISRLIRLEKRRTGEIAVVYDEEDELEYISDNNVETR